MSIQIIDTRDLAEELSALEDQDSAYRDELEAAESDPEANVADVIDPLDEEDRARMTAIRELFEEITGYAGDSPTDGISLIAEDSFVEYAQEFAEDIGAVNSDASWPLYCIDWERAARDLRMDYTSVDFDGTSYLYR